MDRAIEKKKWTSKKIITLTGILALMLLIFLSFYLTSGKSRLNVNPERITISEVKNGIFQEFIPVNGVVLPMTTIYLDAAEGGRVEEIMVEDGTMMKKNEPILKLSNTDLELSLSNQETSVFDVLTQMQNTKNNADQNTIRQLNQMADVENAYLEAERINNLNKLLYDSGAIGSQEFNSSLNNFNYQRKRKKLSEEILFKDSLSSTQQVKQMKESYLRMQNALQLMKRKVDDLVVRAPVDGMLSSLDAEMGQLKNKGERLGQIDVMSGFKIRSDIDEHYISRIYPGLQGDFTLADKTYHLKIKKVFAQVTNGRFQVDMEFAGEVPKGIRRGQTLQIRLTLSDETKALLVPKGGFYQQTGGNWIFKMDASGEAAYKADIQLGRQNPDYYEVLQGLKAGDKVITSGYENYERVQELILQK